MSFLANQTLAGACLAGLLFLSGCGKFFVDENGGGGTTTCTNNCIYVGNGTADDIAAFAAVNPLTVVSSTNVGLSDEPTAMVVTPNDTLLFVASAATGAIFALPIQSGGALGTPTTASAGTTIPVEAITVDRTGSFLLAAQEQTNATCASGFETAVEIFSIATGGVLTETYVTPSALIVCGVPTSIAISPNSVYAFVGLQGGGIAQYAYTTGTFTNTTPVTFAVPAATQVNALAIDPTSTYVFAAESGTSGGLAQLKIATGGLTQVAISSSSTAVFQVAVDPSSTYVYAGDNNTGDIYGYSYAATGLTAISGSPFAPSAAANTINGLAVDSSGSFVISIYGSGPNLQEFMIGTGGALTANSTGTTGSTTYTPQSLALSH